MIVTIRRFERSDIPKKVEWINNPENNRFLHYDIPINALETERWFDRHLGETNRYDAVFEANGVPVGTIGLLDIDYKNGKAEYYIAMGEVSYKGHGIAKEATKLILQYGFEELTYLFLFSLAIANFVSISCILTFLSCSLLYKSKMIFSKEFGSASLSSR